MLDLSRKSGNVWHQRCGTHNGLARKVNTIYERPEKPIRIGCQEYSTLESDMSPSLWASVERSPYYFAKMMAGQSGLDWTRLLQY